MMSLPKSEEYVMAAEHVQEEPLGHDGGVLPPLFLKIEPADSYGLGHYVYLNGHLIGHRISGGSDTYETVVTEVEDALATLIGDKLGWREEES